MKRIAAMLVLVGMCAGMDCQGNGPAGFTPQCFTTWFSEEFGVGFNPPPDFVGPTTPGILGLTFPLSWDSPNSSTSFSVLPSSVEGQTFEESVSVAIQLLTIVFPTILVNEPFRLNNGQDGWLVVARDNGELVNFLSVKTFVSLGPGRGTWQASGTGFTDEVTAEDLLGVVRTLCVESVEN